MLAVVIERSEGVGYKVGQAAPDRLCHNVNSPVNHWLVPTMVTFYKEDLETLALSVGHLFATAPAALHTVAISVANEALD